MPEIVLVEGIVGQMSFEVVQGGERVRLGTQSDVAVRKHVYFQRIDASEQDPLPDIKFPATNSSPLQHQRSLDVLLHHPGLHTLVAAQYIPAVVFQCDTVTSGGRARFGNPYVVLAVSRPFLLAFVLEIDVFFDDSLQCCTGWGGVVLADED